MPATLADIQAKYGESVYPIYKELMYEPYVETDTGGYGGVILYDESQDKIRCEECGKWFTSLEKHVEKIHSLSVREYKIKYELLLKIPLISRGLSEKRSIAGLESKKRHGLPKFPSDKSYRSHLNITRKTTGFKNKLNLCDAQIITRLEVVRQMGGELTTSNLAKYDNKLYKYLIHKYGSVEDTCKKYEIMRTNNSGQALRDRLTDVMIITELRKWVVTHGIIPTYKDMKRKNGLPSWQTIYNHFGSYRRAIMMAGLDQLLEEVKS